MGGLAAFHLSLIAPTTFGMSFCLSPSLFAGHDIVTVDEPFEHSKLFMLYDEVLKNPQYQRPKIYLDWGASTEGDIQTQTLEELTGLRCRDAVEILCTKYGFELDKDLFAVEVADGRHNEESWAKRFGAVLLQFFRQPSS